MVPILTHARELAGQQETPSSSPNPALLSPTWLSPQVCRSLPVGLVLVPCPHTQWGVLGNTTSEEELR